MDLLYSRYSSPFSFINGLLEIGEFTEGIRAIYKQNEERKMWEMYLHSNPYIAPQKSFIEWKKAITSQSSNSRALSKEQIEVEVKKSQDILDSFHLKVGD